MFTGIVQATAPVIEIIEKKYFRTYYVRLPSELLQNLTIGSSIANNGCCLTVTSIINDKVGFDLIEETLMLTNLSELKVGDEVNIERSAKLQTEVGGHIMSGHITGTAILNKILTSENNRRIWFSLNNKKLMKYILHKGYIGIDGISLTINEIMNNSFCVNLIPETLLRTTIGKKCLGNKVNIEIDLKIQAIVDTVERVLRDNKIIS